MLGNAAGLVGAALSRDAVGDGAYKGEVGPNIITRLAPASEDSGGVLREPARLLARAVQCIAGQDAVFFRFENRSLEGRTLTEQMFCVVYPDAGASLRFLSQADAEEFLKKKVDKARKRSARAELAKAFVLEFDADLTLGVMKAPGEDAGYTRTGPREITVVNFRDDGIAMHDEEFARRLSASLFASDGAAQVRVRPAWEEGEYGYQHDWCTDPQGRGVLDRLGSDGRRRLGLPDFRGVASMSRGD